MAGILASRALAFSNEVLFLALLLFLILLGIAAGSGRKSLLIFALLGLFFFLGHWGGQLSASKVHRESNLSRFTQGEKVYWLGRVSELCRPTEEGGKIVVELWEVKQAEQVFPAQGKVLLTVGGEGACAFGPGDVLQGYSKLKEPDYFRNRHAFDYPFYLLSQGITATAFAESKEHLALRAEGLAWLQARLTKLRKSAAFPMDGLRNPEAEELLKAMLLGSSQKLGTGLQDLFRRTGTSHLLVVSGLHLAMVMGFFYFLFRSALSLYPPLLLRVSARKFGYWAALPCVILYALLVGMTPSLWRSLLSILGVGFLLIHRRSKDGLGLLYAIAFALLLFQPLLAFDLSFELSFLSIFSILALVPPGLAFLKGRFPGLASRKPLWGVLEVLLASLAAQFGLFPLLVNHFHEVSWVSLPANMLLIPYFSFVLMPLGMLGLVSAWVHPSLAHFVFEIASSCCAPALQWLRFLASFSWSTSWLPRMGAVQVLLYGGLFAWLWNPWGRSRKAWMFLLLLLLNLGAWFYPAWADARRRDFRISFLDVGQGDAMLLEFPGGKKMLVDAGGTIGSSFDLGEKVLLPALLDRGVRHLDYLVLTHPHPDHFGGMKALLKAYAPEEFWWNGEQVPSEDFQALLSSLRERNVLFVKKDSGSPPLQIGGARVEFLNPTENAFVPLDPDGAFLNNHSLVIRIQDRGFSLLLAGDAQKEAEAALLASGRLSPVDLLKVPHHGSDTSSTEAFVKQVRPRFALIQAGRKNRFGFPKPEVLARYQAIGAKIYGSYQNGETEFDWDGARLEIRCESGCEPREP